MQILLNNMEAEFESESISVSEMLKLKKYTFKMKIIKVNGKLILKEQYDTTIIENGDEVQMLYLMSGG